MNKNQKSSSSSLNKLNRKKVTVSKNQGRILLQKYKKYTNDHQKMISELLVNAKQSYFLIPINFISEWSQYCNSTDQERYQPSPMNQCIDKLIDFNKKMPHQNARYKQHYLLLNQTVSQHFKPFSKGIQQNTLFVEWARDPRSQQVYPIFLIKFEYLMINKSLLAKIDCGYIDPNSLAPKKLQFPPEQLIQTLFQQIRLNQNLHTDKNINVWLIGKGQSFQTIMNSILQQILTLCFANYQIKNIGEKISNSDYPLYSIFSKNYQNLSKICLLVESYSNQNPVLIENFCEKCPCCKKQKQLQFSCKCKKIRYCSARCLSQDQISHSENCSFLLDMTQTKDSCEGLAGIKNLGNTCYMNSCLQCLSHTQPLTNDYFLNGLFLKQIKNHTQSRSNGVFANLYAKFIKAMWCDPWLYQQKVYQPDELKSKISQSNKLFAGSNQHDAEQFLTFFLDQLHNDLNRVRQDSQFLNSFSKYDEESDQLLAKQSWMNHWEKNQSIITEIMNGQFLSKKQCPDCNRQSKKFQIFTSISLPIAVDTLIPFYLIFQNMEKPPQRHFFVSKTFNPEQWHKKACESAKTDIEKCNLYLVTKNQNIYKVGKDSLSEILSKLQNQSKNIFMIQKSQQQMQIPNYHALELTIMLSKVQNFSLEKKVQVLFFKFPMIFDKRTVNLQNISKRILKFISKQAYNNLIQTVSKYYDYIETMLKNKIFKVYFKFNKSIVKQNDSIISKFDGVIQLQPNYDLINLLQKKNLQPKDCEIQIRFTAEKISQFNFSRLSKFKNGQETPNIPQLQTVDLNDCLQIFSQPQILESGNQWYCSECKSKQKAIAQIKIYRAPKIVIFQLKRFKYKDGKKYKINHKVNFPFKLQLKNFVIDQKPIEAYKDQLNSQIFIKPKHTNLTKNTDDKNSPPNYYLYAVINHYDNQLGGGHYKAFAKNKNQWYCFDDFRVPQKIHQKSVCSNNAYILFYQRQ